MKHTAGYAKPRRITASRRPVRTRLNLQRRPNREPADELEDRQKQTFWKWVLLIALLHVLAILGVYLFFEFSPATKPPQDFITLLPPGDTVKGTAGVQQAHRIGANTPAAPAHHAAPPPPASALATPPAPKVVAPPPVVKPPPPPPILNETAPPIAPVKLASPKPARPPKPKVKIDLHEVVRTDAAATEPPKKPAKHHAKKPVKNPDDSQDEADSSPDNTGLSKEQIAEKLGEKLNASGVKDAIKSGASGSDHGKDNPFGEFYALLHDQVMELWTLPNQVDDAAVNPVVEIHVERDGRVSPELVRLTRSSGNQAYDDSALQAAKNLGYLREPLPDGCPPDISITFKPNR
jgi:TonB family protein